MTEEPRRQRRTAAAGRWQRFYLPAAPPVPPVPFAIVLATPPSMRAFGHHRIADDGRRRQVPLPPPMMSGSHRNTSLGLANPVDWDHCEVRSFRQINLLRIIGIEATSAPTLHHGCRYPALARPLRNDPGSGSKLRNSACTWPTWGNRTFRAISGGELGITLTNQSVKETIKFTNLHPFDAKSGASLASKRSPSEPSNNAERRAACLCTRDHMCPVSTC